MSEQNKRQRGKNFSHTEESLLLDLVESQKNILENKKSDAVTWKQKEECWEKLAVEFASQSGSVRSVRTLKDKYDNLKRKCKAEVAKEKHETYRTGGGPPTKNCVSNVSERIVSLIGESATGLNNEFDSDFAGDSRKSLSIPEAQTVVMNDNNVVLEILEEIDAIGDDEDGETKENDNLMQTPKWNPILLKEKKSKKLSFAQKNTGRRSFEEERITLTKLQQDFYRGENIRAIEKHKEELKALRLKNELLEMEVAEKKKKF